MEEVNGRLFLFYRQEHQELKQLKNQGSGYPAGEIAEGWAQGKITEWVIGKGRHKCQLWLRGKWQKE